MKSKLLTTLVGLFLSLLFAQSAFTQCQPLYVFTGKAALDFFGYSVAGAGDVNNDGYDDIIVGALFNQAVSSDSGQVFVFSGLDGDTLYVFNGGGGQVKFGCSVAGAGDVNNDGYADVIIGAMEYDTTGKANVGRAYVFSGLDGDTLYVFTGEEAGDKFGTSVAGAGDVDIDGYDDLIVGAPFFDLSHFNGGEAYIFSGQTGIGINRISAPGPDDEFSSAVASAGDVDNDGKSDVIVGARLNDNNGSNAGFATVMSQGVFLVGLYEGEAANHQFGNAVASAGDVDNDGFDDVIVGAHRYNAAQSSGRAYVFDVHDQDTLHIFSGASGDRFGTAVGPMGDINKDGYDDVLVSAIESDGALIDAGRVFVLSGFNGDTLHVFEGESSLDEFGWSAASAGDVDNDGFNDVIVGAECNSANGNCAGRVYVFSCCCLGNRGDFNGDGNNSTILDLNYLVNDIFRGGPSAACRVEADLNDDSSSSTILDLNFLVNDIFRGGPSAGACY